jgi:Gram-negative bacterial TonB protein C-terminal
MKVRGKLAGSAFALALAIVTPSALASEDQQLEEIKRLYFAAKYEDTLAALTRAFPSGSLEGDEYIVLCYLGLGRAAEAEQVLERLVLKNPLVPLDMTGRSPKFAAAYQPVRQRLAAVVAETMYGLARASFKSGQLAVAAAQFKELAALLVTVDAKDQRANDLRLLADGFARLSEPRMAVVEPAPPRPLQELTIDDMVVMNVVADAPMLPPAEPKPFSPWRPQTFSASDPDVKPPVVVAQALPAWNPPRAYAYATLKGSVELLIGEDGLVISVKTVGHSHPLYDQMLLEAAKEWEYQPATKDGRPVKYRKVVEVTLRGR